MRLREKIIPWTDLESWRAEVLKTGQRLVVTNGCFDLLHSGHVTYLEEAGGLGDILLVGLNSDAGVRELKGPQRPVNPERERALVVASLQSVQAVCVFPGKTAFEFLQVARPDIYVKGGDYTLDTLNQEERRLVEGLGAKIAILPLVPDRSTTQLLEKIHRL